MTAPKKLGPAHAEMTRRRGDFIRAGRKYALHVQRQIRDGLWDALRHPAEIAFLRAFEALVFAEQHAARRGKGSM